MLAAGSEIGQGKVLFLEPDSRAAQAAAGDLKVDRFQAERLLRLPEDALKVIHDSRW